LHVNGAKGDGLAAYAFGMNSIWHNRKEEVVAPY